MQRSKNTDPRAAIAGEVTRLLQDWSAGEPAARDRLFALIYDELRRLAHHQRRREHSPEALGTTALVHEAYLRMVDAQLPMMNARAHFFGIAARVMRCILIDEARARKAKKRSASELHLAFDGAHTSVDLLELDEALQALAKLDPRQATLVELRFFGGLTESEAAEVLAISVPTVKRDWTMARAWLFRALAKAP